MGKDSDPQDEELSAREVPTQANPADDTVVDPAAGYGPPPPPPPEHLSDEEKRRWAHGAALMSRMLGSGN